MVSGLSALDFAPNAPATGQPVCRLVTPALSNGNSYLFSFQHILRPSFPSCLNGNPPILFPFSPLQPLSSPTGGYTPLPRAFFTKGSSSGAHPFLLSPESTQILAIRPSEEQLFLFSTGLPAVAGLPKNRRLASCRRVSTRLERLMPFTSHGSPITIHSPFALRERRIDARFAHFFTTSSLLATHTFLVGGGGYPFHFMLESAALKHLQRATIQGSQPRGDTGRTIDCTHTGCDTIARPDAIERKRCS